ncbi:MAG: DNA/RNA non-specific endonuclease [Bacteroidota bacterium]
MFNHPAPVQRQKSLAKATLLLLLLTWVRTPALPAQDLPFAPAPVADHPVINHSQYSFSYNEAHEQADWVTYLLTEAEVNAPSQRHNRFYEDDQVRSKSASPADYANSGFDRGHLSPSADNYITTQANRESFFMSNISPQLPDFNRTGAWPKLEKWVRKQAEQLDSIYVVTGPVFRNSLGTIGENEVTIPGYFYKALLRFDEEGRPHTIAFLVPHLDSDAELKQCILPVNSLESITGIDFFPFLDDSVENQVESSYSKKAWKSLP